MLKNSSKMIACALSGSIIFATSGSAVAEPNPHPALPKQVTSGLRASSSMSDAAVAQLLLTGTGAAAASHARVVRLLGFDRIKVRAPQSQIHAFVDGFVAATPTFHRDVVLKIRSGDPYEVRDALVNVTRELRAFLDHERVHVQHADSGKLMSPNGWWWTVTNGGVAVNVGAVVNGGLYANVAVATEVAVAAAVVWLAGVVLTYKFDPSSTDRLDHDTVVAAITRDLRPA